MNGYILYCEVGKVFGFVVANPEKLTEEQRKRYKGVYCGVCENLGRERGFRYRMCLTYDLAFLALVLSASEGEEYSEKTGRCPVHPTRKRSFLVNRFTEYSADMNIALSYYKFIDDKNDDNSVTASLKAGIFEKEAKRIFGKYPAQCESIVRCLERLQEIEKADVHIPDIPASVFGELLGSIFVFDGLENKELLYDFGFALGKFIYVMDATVDLKGDLKRQRYNPLVRYSVSDTEKILEMLMAECVEKYKSLNVKQDREIIENILFSGVWMKYRPGKKGNKSEQRPL